MQLLWIFLGGGLGSVCRYLVSRLVGVDQVFPFATLSANFLASFMLGLLFGMAGNDILSERQKLFFMTGFCGGFSTFSTFSLDNFNMLDAGNFLSFGLNVLLSVVICLCGIWLGYRISA
jgi:CrcB protein